ncbi:hypothetical protein [Cyanobium sp. ATX-6F1]|uniref:hypothetical protein n=1 Tax=Cyanobium sp. ATX-6F1 TaxID=3137388 RepID=UPI0039BDAA19
MAPLVLPLLVALPLLAGVLLPLLPENRPVLVRSLAALAPGLQLVLALLCWWYPRRICTWPGCRSWGSPLILVWMAFPCLWWC